MESLFDTVSDPEQTAFLRRLRALVAPIAADAGADDPALLDVAQAVYAAFGESGASGGLAKAQIAALCFSSVSSATGWGGLAQKAEVQAGVRRAPVDSTVWLLLSWVSKGTPQFCLWMVAGGCARGTERLRLWWHSLPTIAAAWCNRRGHGVRTGSALSGIAADGLYIPGVLHPS